MFSKRAINCRNNNKSMDNVNQINSSLWRRSKHLKNRTE